MTDAPVDLDLPRVSAFALGSVNALVSSFDEGVDVLRLDGRTVVDRAAFMAQVAVDIRLPEDLSPSGWDGFADAMWQVLAERSGEAAVLLWSNADVLIERSINDFLAALTALNDVARAVSTTTTGFPRRLQFCVVLLGDGPNFPRYSPTAAPRFT